MAPWHPAGAPPHAAGGRGARAAGAPMGSEAAEAGACPLVRFLKKLPAPRNWWGVSCGDIGATVQRLKEAVSAGPWTRCLARWMIAG